MRSIRPLFLGVILFIGTAAVQATTEGTWIANTTTSDSRIHLMLQWETSNWGRSIPFTDLRGVSRQQISADISTPVHFQIDREPGSFAMEGVFRDGKGAGHFRFTPNRNFISTLRSLRVEGSEDVTDRQLMTLAISDVSRMQVEEFSSLGLRPLGVRQLTQLSIHGVTAGYVRALRARGISDTEEVRHVVALRIHGVTPELLDAWSELGYRDLSRKDVMQMSIHGVRPSFIRELRELGYADLSPKQLVRMRIHGVTPSFIREAREAGYSDLPPDTLVRMKIHGIDSELLRSNRRRR
jgi:hypothetical protein